MWVCVGNEGGKWKERKELPRVLCGYEKMCLIRGFVVMLCGCVSVNERGIKDRKTNKMH